jgi:phosphoglycolate phosphatase
MTAAAYDFWLFDLDGTLVDVETAYAREVFDAVADRLGTDFSDRDVTILWHGLHGSRNDYLARMGLDHTRFWEEFHEVEDAQARSEATFLHPDASFVGDLEVPVGLVTHCQSYLTGPVLDHLDIGDWFDVVVCCTDETGWKPDPEPVRTAMAEMGVLDHVGGKPVATDGGYRRGVLAGDSPGDVGAAWNAELDALHVERHGSLLRGGEVVGDLQVRSFTDLF